MDAEPGTSGEKDLLSPKKKRLRSAISPTEKVMIINVYKHVLATWPQDEYCSKVECTKKTAEITGVSTASVYTILKDYKQENEMPAPKKTGPKQNFKDKIGEYTFAAIRRIVHQFFFRHEAPTIAKVSSTMFCYGCLYL